MFLANRFNLKEISQHVLQTIGLLISRFENK